MTPPDPLLVRRVGACAATAFAVLLVLVLVRWSPLHTLDLRVAGTLNDRTAPHPALVRGWKLVSEIGQPATFQVASVVAAIWLWTRRQVATAIFVAGTVLTAGLLSTVVKLLVGRDRPQVDDPVAHAAGMSFPSGHAMASFVATAVLLLVVVPRCGTRARRVLIPLGVLVVGLVAFSRLALGVHYVSDVLAGWTLGTAWVAVGLLLVQREAPLSRQQRPAPAPPSPGPRP